MVAQVPGLGELPLLDGLTLPVFADEASAVFCATVAHRSRPASVTAIVVEARREAQLQAWSVIGGRRTTRVDGAGGGAVALDLARRMVIWLDGALAADEAAVPRRSCCLHTAGRRRCEGRRRRH